MSESGWHSIHIFYAGSMDKLLLEGFFPILSSLEDLAESPDFFFIRYWNGGPHIRVRFRSGDEVKRNINEIIEKLHAWLVNNPAGRLNIADYQHVQSRMESIRKKLPVELRILMEPTETLAAGDSIEHHEYSFDVFRYGDVSLRDFIEKHFCWSSLYAKSLLVKTASCPEIRVTLSLYIAAATFGATGYGVAEGARFFREISHWSSDLIQVKHDNAVNELGDSDTYDLESGVTSSLGQQIMEGLPAKSHSPWINAVLILWQEECQRILHDAHLIDASSLKQEPVHLLMDFLHMLNNRLNISIGEEAYIYHLIAEQLERLVPLTNMEKETVS